jgi:hypothetical protein
MSTISSGSSGLTWTSDNSSNLAITLTSIVDNTGNTVTGSTVVKGSAKAWVNFNGTGTVVIRSSFNVSSITDNGTGDYTVNFTNAMVDANYNTLTSMSQYLSYAVPGFSSQVAAIGAKTTTSQRVYCGQAAATNNVTWGALDYNEVCVTIFN